MFDGIATADLVEFVLGGVLTIAVSVGGWFFRRIFTSIQANSVCVADITATQAAHEARLKAAEEIIANYRALRENTTRDNFTRLERNIEELRVAMYGRRIGERVQFSNPPPS
ncbi:MAG: hypothetical protein LBR05_01055 [Azoarcus sp.]|jgi:hypothetical protein|nr:hypothetical protein [Azoarcus sp.]